MNTFAEPLEIIFRMNKRDGQVTIHTELMGQIRDIYVVRDLLRMTFDINPNFLNANTMSGVGAVISSMANKANDLAEEAYQIQISRGAA